MILCISQFWREMNVTPKGWVEDDLLEVLFTEMGMVKGNHKKLETITTLIPERQDFTQIQ